jgi:hypothetical protein
MVVADSPVPTMCAPASAVAVAPIEIEPSPVMLTDASPSAAEAYWPMASSTIAVAKAD